MGVSIDPPYRVPRARRAPRLRLDGNEGEAPAALLAALVEEGLDLARYPDASALESALADRFGLAPEQVLVTAGADDALDRACRAFLRGGRRLVWPTPGFEMVARYARLAGGEVDEVPWGPEGFPAAAVASAVRADTGLVVLTSPNNPTGELIREAELRAVLASAGEAVVVVDEAYVELAPRDLLRPALEGGAIVLRTFSKAWGLAGLRVGYALGPAARIAELRAAGAPYAVSSISLALASRALALGEEPLERARDEVAASRARMQSALARCGARTRDSRANFLFFEVEDPRFVRDACAALEVGVRVFPGRPGLERAVRVSCPRRAADRDAAIRALEVSLAPEALLFDLDGVLADVSRSYRAAIARTCASYGVDLDSAEISRAKAAGDANDDWRLTWRLLRARGVDAALVEVTARFESLYQGGLFEAETATLSAAELLALKGERRAAIVTGRPRADAVRFLERAGLLSCFEAVVCREDAALKPDPAPVRLALARLGVERAWMVGDTVDDVEAARAAGVVPIGVLAPGEGDPAAARAALEAAGAAAVVEGAGALKEVIR